MTVVAVAARLAVLPVTIGATAATWTAVLLLAPSVVTIAVRLPAAGAMENRTVSEFAVAPVTTPAPVVEGDGVVRRRRIEAEAVDGDSRGVRRQAGGAAGYDRRDRGHLHCRAAAVAAGSDRGGQIAERRKAWCRMSR